MRRARVTVLTVALALPALVALAARARADEPSALERVRGALERTRRDLEAARVDAAATGAETARLVSAADAGRTAAAARLEGARVARRTLAARETQLRSENERLAAEADALDAEVAQDRDALRRVALEAAASGASRDARARLDAVAKRSTEAGADVAALASEVLGALADDARGAPRLAEETVEVDGVGPRRGRVLRIGPGAWLLGADGTEALRRGRAGPTERFVVRRGEGIAAAFAAIERGEREVELPLDPTGGAQGSGSFVASAAALLVEGGFVMLPLGLLWAVSVFLVLERLLARRRIAAEGADLVTRVRAAVVAGDLEAARRAAREGGAVGRALARGIGASPEVAIQASDAARAALLGLLRRRLWLLGTVAATAPFVGLFGTVVGIVRSFRDMARTGSSGFAVVAAGISEALVATGAGIVVAVLAVLAFNALQAAAASAADALRARAEEALNRGA